MNSNYRKTLGCLKAEEQAAFDDLREELAAIKARIEANKDDLLSGAGPDSTAGYFEDENFGAGLPFKFRLMLQIAKDQGRAEVLEGACEGLEMALLMGGE